MAAPPTIPVTLDSLIEVSTPTDLLTQSLQICQQLSLPTAAWQSVQMIPDLIEVNATLASGASTWVSLVAQGAYASSAALIVDAAGNPVTTWMALRAQDQYNITPQPPTFASGPVPYTNGSSTTYNYTPNNPLHCQNAVTGASYTSVGTGSVFPGSQTIQFQADVQGSAGTSGAGVQLVLTTPLNAVVLNPLVTSMVGSDLESNASVLLRGQYKLATLAPIQSTDEPGPVSGSPAGAYGYVAQTIPQNATSSAVPPYAVTAVITGTAVQTNPLTGTVNVIVRNASGPPSGVDVAVVNAAVQALVTPDAVTVVVLAATDVDVLVNAIIYIRTSSGVTGAAAVTNSEDALATYFSSVSIGGLSTTATNILPLSDLSQTIFSANSGTVDVILTSPTVAPYLGPSGIPSLDPLSTFTVQFV